MNNDIDTFSLENTEFIILSPTGIVSDNMISYAIWEANQIIEDLNEQAMTFILMGYDIGELLVVLDMRVDGLPQVVPDTIVKGIK